MLVVIRLVPGICLRALRMHPQRPSRCTRPAASPGSTLLPVTLCPFPTCYYLSLFTVIIITSLSHSACIACKSAWQVWQVLRRSRKMICTMTCACGQVLICPALDLAELNTPSYAEFKDDKWESKADLEWFWKQYLQVTNYSRFVVVSGMVVLDAHCRLQVNVRTDIMHAPFLRRHRRHSYVIFSPDTLRQTIQSYHLLHSHDSLCIYLSPPVLPAHVRLNVAAGPRSHTGGGVAAACGEPGGASTGAGHHRRSGRLAIRGGAVCYAAAGMLACLHESPHMHCALLSTC